MGACINCRFVGFLNSDLVCWRNAPMAHAETCPDCTGVSVITVQPGVSPDDVCGEYEEALPAKQAQTQRTFDAIQREYERQYYESLRNREDEDHHDSNVVTLRNAKPKGNA